MGVLTRLQKMGRGRTCEISFVKSWNFMRTYTKEQAILDLEPL